MSSFIITYFIYFGLVCLGLILGGRLLRGVTLSTGTAIGLTILFGIVNFILSDFHTTISENFNEWLWTPIYIIYDTLLLLIFSRFLSGIKFRNIGWAFLLGLFMGAFNTLGNYLLALFVYPHLFP